MAETTTLASGQQRNPLELAASVSRQVEIKDVLLAESRTFRAPDATELQHSLRLEFTISNINWDTNRDLKQVIVKPSFVLCAFNTQEGEASDSPTYLIEATFVLVYSLESFEGVSDENFDAFAMTNGIYNAWPYWREIAQNSTIRMGLNPVIIPVFRL